MTMHVFTGGEYQETDLWHRVHDMCHSNSAVRVGDIMGGGAVFNTHLKTE